MPRTAFQIVLGTHDATPVPAAARAHGLTHRFALVQSSPAAGGADLVVDPAPLLAVLAVLDAHCPTAGKLYWDELRRSRNNLDAVAQHYRTTLPDNHSALSAGEWHRQDQLVVLLHTERGAAAGSAPPHPGSFTYSFYCAEDRSQELLAALRAAGHEPSAIHRATTPAPSVRRTRAQKLADTGFVAAFACVVLTGLIVAGAELLDLSPRLDPWIDFAGAWLAYPLALSIVYSAGYLIARRGQHPFTRIQ
ncbi:MAG: hypothetical protein QG602_396 [Verrucomicrobiota bacterium]|nr:hypothetical protein [Verrucomicrobiota bacterium]